jgi:cell division protein FtsQ
MKEFLHMLIRPKNTMAVAVAVLGLGLALYALDDMAYETRYISVTGNISAQQRSEIFVWLSDFAAENADIENIKKELEAKSWVAHAAVERHWPDGLVISIEPEIAIALWNDDAFINDRGKVFSSEYVSAYNLSKRVGPLTQLYGPAGREMEVMQQYQRLNNALLKEGRSIDILRLNSRGGWVFVNDMGIEVLLGKDELMERIQRLLKVAGHVDLNGKLDEVRSIDARYSNGVAVSWKNTVEGMEIAKTFNSQREQKL